MIVPVAVEAKARTVARLRADQASNRPESRRSQCTARLCARQEAVAVSVHRSRSPSVLTSTVTELPSVYSHRLTRQPGGVPGDGFETLITPARPVSPRERANPSSPAPLRASKLINAMQQGRLSPRKPAGSKRSNAQHESIERHHEETQQPAGWGPGSLFSEVVEPEPEPPQQAVLEQLRDQCRKAQQTAKHMQQQKEDLEQQLALQHARMHQESCVARADCVAAQEECDRLQGECERLREDQARWKAEFQTERWAWRT